MGTEPVFPLDLEREIFETTAVLYPATIPTLLRVARRVLIWIEPLLYRTIRLDRSWIAQGIAQAMQLKPASFFRKSVRHLYISPQARWSAVKVYELLRLCSRLVSLFVVGHLSDPTLLPILEGKAQVRRWGGCLGNLFGSSPAIDLNHSFFRTITHLDVFEALNGRNNDQLCLGLTELPALTHLCLNNDASPSIVQRLLEQCLHLKILLNLWHQLYAISAQKIAASPSVTDARFVVAVWADYWSDWERWARGGTDIWAAADAFVARKRGGEIEASCYWLEY
ncbi:hypothetical protein B0H19DRAFT_1157107 [Mycena capillaripes]|nr:hypothetical protein B0H19DRAFT_1157107 [Mycena capillaripes]